MDLGEQRRVVGKEIRQREGGCRGEQVDGEKVASVPFFLLPPHVLELGQRQGRWGRREGKEAGTGSGWGGPMA